MSIRRFLEDTNRPARAWTLLAIVSFAGGVGLVALVRWIGWWG